MSRSQRQRTMIISSPLAALTIIGMYRLFLLGAPFESYLLFGLWVSVCLLLGLGVVAVDRAYSKFKLDRWKRGLAARTGWVWQDPEQS